MDQSGEPIRNFRQLLPNSDYRIESLPHDRNLYVHLYANVKRQAEAANQLDDVVSGIKNICYATVQITSLIDCYFCCLMLESFYTNARRVKINYWKYKLIRSVFLCIYFKTK